jgi:hypothetical protein
MGQVRRPVCASCFLSAVCASVAHTRLSSVHYVRSAGRQNINKINESKKSEKIEKIEKIEKCNKISRLNLEGRMWDQVWTRSEGRHEGRPQLLE